MTQTPPQPPQPYQQPPVPPGYELKRKKRRKWPWVLGVLVVLIVIIVVSTSHSGGSGISAGSGSSGGSSGSDTVVYSVTSDAPSISATYTTLNGGSIAQAQDNTTTPPWTKTVTAKQSFVHSFNLIASMNPVTDGSGKDGSTITCTITVNGKEVAKQTSTGQYATVTCDAS